MAKRNWKSLPANKPVSSTRPGKKMMVRATEDGKERLVHFGADGYSSNYSKEARKNFKARHNCETPGSKLKARYWACKKLWSANSPVFKGNKKERFK
jgi:hypothetical protein